MIALGFVTAACMMFITRHVWRAADELAARGGDGGPGEEVGVDPMDLPGDGMSPLDLFLTELLSPVAAMDH